MTIASLPLFHRISGQPVIVLGTGEAAEAKRRLVERAGGQVIEELADGIDKGARLAFVAHESEEAARADAIRLRCAGLLVNVVDRPALCDFTTPAIVDRAPVLLAVGTGGASAGLAKALRIRLEALLPPGLGKLARALGEARDVLRKRWPDARDRTQALDAAMGERGALDALRAHGDDALDAWLAGSETGTVAQTVEIMLRSGDPDELTLREARLLAGADLVAHEADVPAAILDRARADAAREEIEPGAAPRHAAGLVVVLRMSTR